jgi:hypothetical protein
VHEFDEQLAVLRARLRDVRGHRVEEPMNALGRPDVDLADVLDLEHQPLDARVRDLAEQVELGREVVEKSLLRDVGTLADVGDPGLLEPLFGEEFARRPENPGPHFELPALAPR